MIQFPSETKIFLGKKFGSPVLRSTSIHPINGIDFDLGSFELEDGRSFIVQGTILDSCVYRTKRYIEDGECEAREGDSKGGLVLFDKKTGERLILEENFVTFY